MHILTVDQAVFTKDARFLMHHKPESSQWTLMIKYLQKRDEGTYVCQVSGKILGDLLASIDPFMATLSRIGLSARDPRGSSGKTVG